MSTKNAQIHRAHVTRNRYNRNSVDAVDAVDSVQPAKIPSMN